MHCDKIRLVFKFKFTYATTQYHVVNKCEGVERKTNKNTKNRRKMREVERVRTD